MTARRIELVGPKGYEHNWVFVGVPTHTGLYHASAAHEQIKREGFTKAGSGESGAFFGQGTYFHTNQHDADESLKGYQAFISPDMHQVRADAQVTNPFVVHATKADKSPGAVMQRALQAAGIHASGAAEITSALRQRGYDGVEVRQAGFNHEIAGSQLVAFDPAQIRVRNDLPTDLGPAKRAQAHAGRRAAVDLSANTAAYSETPAPLGRPGGPGLWFKGWKLPDYIENVAKGIMQGGEPDKSRAIALAIGAVKRWAAGGGKVSPEVRAAAAKAVAEWTALKAAASSTPSHSHANEDGAAMSLTWNGVEGIELAAIELVGPKGYEHNWHYVGPQKPGAKVFHPVHGTGTVTAHDGSHVTVSFGKGGERKFEASPGKPGEAGKLAHTPAGGDVSKQVHDEVAAERAAAGDTNARTVTRQMQVNQARRVTAADKEGLPGLVRVGRTSDGVIAVDHNGVEHHVSLRNGAVTVSTEKGMLSDSSTEAGRNPTHAARVLAARIARGEASAPASGSADELELRQAERAVAAGRMLTARQREVLRKDNDRLTAQATKQFRKDRGLPALASDGGRFLEMAFAEAVAERVPPGRREGGQFTPAVPLLGRYDTPGQAARAINAMERPQRAAVRATSLPPPGFSWQAGDRLTAAGEAAGPKA